MGLKNLFKNTPEPPENEDPFFQALLSYSSSDGTFVGSSTLKNSSVYSAINLISSRLANVSLSSNDNKINELLNDCHLRQSLIASALLYGNSFAYYNDGSLQFLPNSNVTVAVDENGLDKKLTYTYTDGDNHSYQLEPEKVLHLYFFSINGLTGVSPLYSLSQEIQLAKSSNDLSLGFFNTPSRNVLKIHKTGLSDEARANLQNQFDNLNNDKLKTLILDDSADYSTKTMDTSALQLSSSVDWATRQIAGAFGIPPTYLGKESEHSNSAQDEEQLKQTLEQYLKLYLAQLSSFFGTEVTYNEFKNLNLKDKVTLIAQFPDLLSQDEIKQLLGLEKE